MVRGCQMTCSTSWAMVRSPSKAKAKARTEGPGLKPGCLEDALPRAEARCYSEKLLIEGTGGGVIQ